MRLKIKKNFIFRNNYSVPSKMDHIVYCSNTHNVYNKVL